jgi:hypothetical protein
MASPRQSLRLPEAWAAETLARDLLNGKGMKKNPKITNDKEVRRPRKAYTKLTTLRGLVIPVAWDEKGNVTDLAVSTDNEEEYLIERSGKGEDLFHFVREEVEVKGILKTDDNRKVINVRTYKKC